MSERVVYAIEFIIGIFAGFFMGVVIMSDDNPIVQSETILTPNEVLVIRDNQVDTIYEYKSKTYEKISTRRYC